MKERIKKAYAIWADSKPDYRWEEGMTISVYLRDCTDDMSEQDVYDFCMAGIKRDCNVGDLLTWHGGLLKNELEQFIKILANV